MLFDHRWPGRPALLPDESFASWFARTAATNGLRPIELYRIVQPGDDHNPLDLDRYADVPLIDRLADSTGRDAGQLEAATFRRWRGRIFEDDDGIHKVPWLPPAGRTNGKRCYGQQFCPLCLAAGDTPYLRLTWRLSFVTTCPLHGCLLLDRCPACNAPVNVLRQDSGDHVACATCGHDLRQARAQPPPVDPLPAQRTLSNMAAQGWTEMGVYGPVYSFVALSVLASLARLLATGRHAHALRAWIGMRDPTLAVRPETIPRAREGALLSPRARSVLVPMAHWLMTDWPDRFVAAAHDIGMGSSDVLKKSAADMPFVFAHAVQWQVREPTGRHAEAEEVIAAKEVLHAQGKRATRRNLAILLGTKAGAVDRLADPAGDGLPWGEGRYWKLDGVSPEVKAAARKAAHRSGEGVGPWLDALLRRELSLPATQSPLNSHRSAKIPADRATRW